MFPALKPVKDLSPVMRSLMRNIFRSMIASPVIKSNLGPEGSEECLEKMYDSGLIKFTFEPIDESYIIGYLLIYEKKISGYRIINNIDISVKQGGI